MKEDAGSNPAGPRDTNHTEQQARNSERSHEAKTESRQEDSIALQYLNDAQVIVLKAVPEIGELDPNQPEPRPAIFPDPLIGALTPKFGDLRAGKFLSRKFSRQGNGVTEESFLTGPKSGRDTGI